MKRLYYIFGLSALLLSSCNYFEYDNYEAPNSGLEGTVVDRKTNEPLQAEAANSYKVEYTFDVKMYYERIPDGEIAKNEKLKQNPYYN